MTFFGVVMLCVPFRGLFDALPCWFIPLTAIGETVNYYANCGTQLELEEALAAWLRKTIRSIELERAAKEDGSTEAE